MKDVVVNSRIALEQVRAQILSPRNSPVTVRECIAGHCALMERAVIQFPEVFRHYSDDKRQALITGGSMDSIVRYCHIGHFVAISRNMAMQRFHTERIKAKLPSGEVLSI